MRVPLGGVDVFHFVNDRVMRRRGLSGNHCAFAVAVEGRLDVASLERRIERAVGLLPELRRRLAWGPAGPAWVDSPDAPPALRVRGAARGGEDAAVTEIADERVSGDAPWGIDLVRSETHDVLVWRWYHPFTDARGAERFVAWLGSGGEGGPADPPPPEDRFDAGARPLAKLDRRARFNVTRAYGDHMLRLAATPIVSLASLTEGPLGRTRAARIRLTAEETAAFDRGVRQKARLAETSVMLFASARLYDGLLRGRGLAPPQHLVPVPLSLDPKAGAARMFGNNLTMMTFSLRRDELDDVARAAASLAEQQRAVVKDRLDVGMLASLDFAKAVPPGIYHWFVTRPFRGEVSSFVLSNPGPVSVTTFAGLPVRDAYALPTVATPPGFQVIFSRHGGRLSAIVGHAEGLLTAEEERGLGARLREELLAV